MMRQLRNSSVVMLLAVAILLVAIAPALAFVQDDGSKNCTGIGAISVRSYATGSVMHYVDYYDWEASFANYSDWKVRYNHEPDTNNTWRVTSNGSLNDPGTYAYCRGL